MKQTNSTRARQIFPILTAAALAAALACNVQDAAQPPSPDVAQPPSAVDVARPPSAADDVLARFGDIEITRSDWADHLLQARLATLTTLTSDEARARIRDELTLLISQRAEDREIAQRAIPESRIGQIRVALAQNEILADQARRVGLPATVNITSEEVEQAYQDASGEFQAPPEITVRHLFLSTIDLDQASQEAKREMAQDIVVQLREDPDRFPEMIEQHSESENRDPAAILGPMGPDAIHEELREALWALDEGDISDPLESRFGIHMFQVVRRFDRAVPLEQARPILEGRVRSQRIDEQIEQLRADAEGRFGLTVPDPPEQLGAETVVLGDGDLEVSGQDLADLFGVDIADVPQGEELASTIRQVQTAAVLAALTREESWDQEEGVAGRLEAARRSALVEALWQARIEASGEINRETALEHYESHPEESRQGRRYTMRVLELRPAAHAERGERFATMDILRQAQEIRARAVSGESFADLVREFSTADDASDGGGPRFIYPLGRDITTWSAVTSLATGEITEPIRASDGYLLGQVEGVEADVQVPFEDVAGDIQRSIRRQRFRQLQRAWTAELNAGVEFSIPDDVVEPLTRDWTPPQPASPEATSEAGTVGASSATPESASPEGESEPTTD